MNDRPTHTENTSLDELESRLVRALGVVVGGRELSRALGYPSQPAFRQAFARGRLPVNVFELQGRRGRYALVSDIARWIWSGRFTGADPQITTYPLESKKESPISKPTG